jgi:hypothetical protein
LGKSRGYFPLFLSLRVSLAVLQPSEAIRSMVARVTTVRVITASKDKAVKIIPIRIFVSIIRNSYHKSELNAIVGKTKN